MLWLFTKSSTVVYVFINHSVPLNQCRHPLQRTGSNVHKEPDVENFFGPLGKIVNPEAKDSLGNHDLKDFEDRG